MNDDRQGEWDEGGKKLPTVLEVIHCRPMGSGIAAVKSGRRWVTDLSPRDAAGGVPRSLGIAGRSRVHSGSFSFGSLAGQCVS